MLLDWQAAGWCRRRTARGVQLVRLLSSERSLRSKRVLRFGLQVVGGLSDNAAVQAELVGANALELVVTAMCRNLDTASVVKWGCVALFSLFFENPSVPALEQVRCGAA